MRNLWHLSRHANRKPFSFHRKGQGKRARSRKTSHAPTASQHAAPHQHAHTHTTQHAHPTTHHTPRGPHKHATSRKTSRARKARSHKHAHARNLPDVQKNEPRKRATSRKTSRTRKARQLKHALPKQTHSKTHFWHIPHFRKKRPHKPTKRRRIFVGKKLYDWIGVLLFPICAGYVAWEIIHVDERVNLFAFVKPAQASEDAQESDQCTECNDSTSSEETTESSGFWAALSGPPELTILPDLNDSAETTETTESPDASDPPDLVAMSEPSRPTGLLGLFGTHVDHHNTPTYEPDSTDNYPLPKRLSIRHVQAAGEGIGFGTNYSTVALLMGPQYHTGHILPLLDLRAHQFNDIMYAANGGAVFRYIPHKPERFPAAFCDILGFNAYYDWRQGRKGTYNEVGAGLEILGRVLDFRANAYFPIGVKRHKSHCETHFDGGFFLSHRSCEFAAYGFNAEFGWLASAEPNNFLFYIAAGPYFLVRKCDEDVLGGEIRIRPQYKDYLALDMRGSWDYAYHGVFEATLILYLPLYNMTPKHEKPCGLTDRQIYQPVERFEIMPLGRRSCWKFNF